MIDITNQRIDKSVLEMDGIDKEFKRIKKTMDNKILQDLNENHLETN